MWSRKIILLSAIFFFVLSVVLPVQAAKEGGYGREGMGQKMKEAGEMMEGRIGFLQEADKITGTHVKNSSGEKIGTIKDLVIDNNQRTVSYVIVSAENKFYPVSWGAFDTSREKFTLDISRDRLSQAPSPGSIDLAQLSNPEYKSKVDNFYSEQISRIKEKGAMGQAAGWMKEKMQQALGTGERTDLSRFSEIKNLTVQNQQGEQLGKLRDALIDVRHGTVAYGTVGFGGLAGVAEKTAVVPWAALTIQPQVGIAKIDTDKATLESAVMTKGQMRQLTEPQFARGIHEKFGTEPYWEVFGFVPGEEMEMSMSAWQADSRYNKDFDPAKMTTIEGTIESVGSFQPEKGAAYGLKLAVKTKPDELVTVHCGPNEYSPQQEFGFKAGDIVSVTGSKVRFGMKHVIMASEIRKGDQH